MFSDIEKCLICLRRCFDGISTFRLIGQTNIVEILGKHFSFIVCSYIRSQIQFNTMKWIYSMHFFLDNATARYRTTNLQ